MLNKTQYYYLRLISLALVVSVSWTSVAFSVPDISSLGPIKKSKLETLQIPSELGRIEELFLPPHCQSDESRCPLIVYLQDAHANLGAQQNIQKIIRELSEELNIHTILAEGASGEADLSVLRSYPNEQAKALAVQFWTGQSVLTGIEAEAIVNPKAFRLRGIENKVFYDSNGTDFLNALAIQKEILPVIETFQKENDTSRAQSYNAALLEFEERVESYEQRSELISLVSYLSNRARELGAKKSDLGEIERLVSLVLLDRALESSKEAEKHDEKREFEKLSREIRPKELFSEFAILKTRIRERLFQNEEERKLHAEREYLKSLHAVLSLQATPEQFEFYERHQKNISIFLNQNHIDPSRINFAEKFYFSNQARDGAFLENVRKIIGNSPEKTVTVPGRGRTFLVTGGFHAKALTQKFRGENIPFVLISPEISQETDYDRYYARMKGEHADLGKYQAKLADFVKSSARTTPLAVFDAAERLEIHKSFDATAREIDGSRNVTREMRNKPDNSVVSRAFMAGLTFFTVLRLRAELRHDDLSDRLMRFGREIDKIGIYITQTLPQRLSSQALQGMPEAQLNLLTNLIAQFRELYARNPKLPFDGVSFLDLKKSFEVISEAFSDSEHLSASDPWHALKQSIKMLHPRLSVGFELIGPKIALEALPVTYDGELPELEVRNKALTEKMNSADELTPNERHELLGVRMSLSRVKQEPKTDDNSPSGQKSELREGVPVIERVMPNVRTHESQFAAIMGFFKDSLVWKNPEGHEIKVRIQVDVQSLHKYKLHQSIEIHVFPAAEELQAHPELDVLKLHTDLDGLPLLGSFGRVILSEVKIQGKPVLLISEVHSSRGFLHLPQENKKRYGFWQKMLLEQIAVAAFQAGYENIYSVSHEMVRKEYSTKRGGDAFWFSDGNLYRHYRKPFRGRWKKTELNDPSKVNVVGDINRYWHLELTRDLIQRIKLSRHRPASVVDEPTGASLPVTIAADPRPFEHRSELRNLWNILRRVSSWIPKPIRRHKLLAASIVLLLSIGPVAVYRAYDFYTDPVRQAERAILQAKGVDLGFEHPLIGFLDTSRSGVLENSYFQEAVNDALQYLRQSNRVRYEEIRQILFKQNNNSKFPAAAEVKFQSVVSESAPAPETALLSRKVRDTFADAQALQRLILTDKYFSDFVNAGWLRRLVTNMLILSVSVIPLGIILNQAIKIAARNRSRTRERAAQAASHHHLAGTARRHSGRSELRSHERTAGSVERLFDQTTIPTAISSPPNANQKSELRSVAESDEPVESFVQREILLKAIGLDMSHIFITQKKRDQQWLDVTFSNGSPGERTPVAHNSFRISGDQFRGLIGYFRNMVSVEQAARRNHKPSFSGQFKFKSSNQIYEFRFSVTKQVIGRRIGKIQIHIEKTNVITIDDQTIFREVEQGRYMNKLQKAMEEPAFRKLYYARRWVDSMLHVQTVSAAAAGSFLLSYFVSAWFLTVLPVFGVLWVARQFLNRGLARLYPDLETERRIAKGLIRFIFGIRFNPIAHWRFIYSGRLRDLIYDQISMNKNPLILFLPNHVADTPFGIKEKVTRAHKILRQAANAVYFQEQESRIKDAKPKPNYQLVWAIETWLRDEYDLWPLVSRIRRLNGKIPHPSPLPHPRSPAASTDLRTLLGLEQGRISGFTNQVRKMIRGPALVFGLSDNQYVAKSLKTPWDTSEDIEIKIRDEQNKFEDSFNNILGQLNSSDLKSYLEEHQTEIVSNIWQRIHHQKFNAEAVFDGWIEEMKKYFLKESKTDLAGEIADFGAQVIRRMKSAEDLEVSGDEAATEKRVAEEIENFNIQLGLIKRDYDDQINKLTESNASEDEILAVSAYVLYLEDIRRSVEKLIRDEKKTALSLLKKHSNAAFLTSLQENGQPISNLGMAILKSRVPISQVPEKELVMWQAFKEMALSVNYLIAQLGRGTSFVKKQDPPARIGERINDEIMRFNRALEIARKEIETTGLHAQLTDLSIAGLLERIEAEADELIREEGKWLYAELAVQKAGRIILDELQTKHKSLPSEEDKVKLGQLTTQFKDALILLGKHAGRGFVVDESRQKTGNLVLFADAMSFVSLFQLLEAYPNIKAIAVKEGTPASHLSIFAASIGVMVFNSPDLNLDNIQAGADVYADGEKQELVVNPSYWSKRALDRRFEEENVLDHLANAHAHDSVFVNGTQLTAGLSLSSPKKILEHADAAKKVGLLRTEFFTPFILRGEPMNDRAIYQYQIRFSNNLFEMMKVYPEGITVRFIDYQPDKKPQGISRVRDYGLAFYRTEIGGKYLKVQMKAVLDAHLRYSKNVQSNQNILRVMFPVVETPEEAAGLIELWNEAKMEMGMEKSDKSVPLGFMIEKVKAVENLDQILDLADFISIGSNDLTSEVFKANRDNVEHVLYFSQLQPKLLGYIETIVRKAKEKGKPVSICGELAGYRRFDLFTAYLALKYDVDFSLSVDPSLAARIKLMLRHADPEKLRSLFDHYELMPVDTLNLKATEMVEEIEESIKSSDEYKQMEQSLRKKQKKNSLRSELRQGHQPRPLSPSEIAAIGRKITEGFENSFEDVLSVRSVELIEETVPAHGKLGEIARHHELIHPTAMVGARGLNYVRKAEGDVPVLARIGNDRLLEVAEMFYNTMRRLHAVVKVGEVGYRKATFYVGQMLGLGHPQEMNTLRVDTASIVVESPTGLQSKEMTETASIAVYAEAEAIRDLPYNVYWRKFVVAPHLAKIAAQRDFKNLKSVTERIRVISKSSRRPAKDMKVVMLYRPRLHGEIKELLEAGVDFGRAAKGVKFSDQKQLDKFFHFINRKIQRRGFARFGNVLFLKDGDILPLKLLHSGLCDILIGSVPSLNISISSAWARTLGLKLFAELFVGPNDLQKPEFIESLKQLNLLHTWIRDGEKTYAAERKVWTEQDFIRSDNFTIVFSAVEPIHLFKGKFAQLKTKIPGAVMNPNGDVEVHVVQMDGVSGAVYMWKITYETLLNKGISKLKRHFPDFPEIQEPQISKAPLRAAELAYQLSATSERYGSFRQAKILLELAMNIARLHGKEKLSTRYQRALEAFTGMSDLTDIPINKPEDLANIMRLAEIFFEKAFNFFSKSSASDRKMTRVKAPLSRLLAIINEDLGDQANRLASSTEDESKKKGYYRAATSFYKKALSFDPFDLNLLAKARKAEIAPAVDEYWRWYYKRMKQNPFFHYGEEWQELAIIYNEYRLYGLKGAPWTNLAFETVLKNVPPSEQVRYLLAFRQFRLRLEHWGVEELQKIEGIDTETAKRIVSYRKKYGRGAFRDIGHLFLSEVDAGPESMNYIAREILPTVSLANFGRFDYLGVDKRSISAKTPDESLDGKIKWLEQMVRRYARKTIESDQAMQNIYSQLAESYHWKALLLSNFGRGPESKKYFRKSIETFRRITQTFSGPFVISAQLRLVETALTAGWLQRAKRELAALIKRMTSDEFGLMGQSFDELRSRIAASEALFPSQVKSPARSELRISPVPTTSRELPSDGHIAHPEFFDKVHFQGDELVKMLAQSFKSDYWLYVGLDDGLPHAAKYLLSAFYLGYWPKNLWDELGTSDFRMDEYSLDFTKSSLARYFLDLKKLIEEGKAEEWSITTIQLINRAIEHFGFEQSALETPTLHSELRRSQREAYSVERIENLTANHYPLSAKTNEAANSGGVFDVQTSKPLPLLQTGSRAKSTFQSRFGPPVIGGFLGFNNQPPRNDNTKLEPSAILAHEGKAEKKPEITPDPSKISAIRNSDPETASLRYGSNMAGRVTDVSQIVNTNMVKGNIIILLEDLKNNTKLQQAVLKSVRQNPESKVELLVLAPELLDGDEAAKTIEALFPGENIFQEGSGYKPRLQVYAQDKMRGLAHTGRELSAANAFSMLFDLAKKNLPVIAIGNPSFLKYLRPDLLKVVSGQNSVEAAELLIALHGMDLNKLAPHFGIIDPTREFMTSLTLKVLNQSALGRAA